MHLLLASKRGLGLVQTIILAKLLTPEIFGVVGVFFIVSNALQSFTNTGFNKALVQSKHLENKHLDTAWTVSVLRGCLLSLLTFLSAPYVVRFLNAPEALNVIKVLSLSLFLQGFYNSGIVYFLRKLDFRKQFLWKISGFTTNFFVSLPLAFILRNEWALVWGVLASNLVDIVVSFTFHPYRPSFSFDYKVFKSLFRYGRWLLLSSIMFFFMTQLDKVVVTKLLGKAELGIYIIALRFARIPEMISNEIPNVMFPVYSKFQDDKAAIKNMFLKTIKVVNIFSIPLVGGIMVIAHPFVSLVLGDKWIDSVVPMQILTLATGVNVIVFGSLSMFNAIGKTNFVFKLNSIKLIVLVTILFPLAVYYKTTGIAVCYLILSLVGLFIWKLEISKVLKVTAKDMFFLIFPLTATLVFVAMIYGINLLAPISRYDRFFFSVSLAIAVYFCCGLMVHKFTRYKVFSEVFEVLRALKAKIIKASY